MNDAIKKLQRLIEEDTSRLADIDKQIAQLTMKKESVRDHIKSLRVAINALTDGADEPTGGDPIKDKDELNWKDLVRTYLDEHGDTHIRDLHEHIGKNGVEITMPSLSSGLSRLSRKPEGGVEKVPGRRGIWRRARNEE